MNKIDIEKELRKIISKQTKTNAFACNTKLMELYNDSIDYMELIMAAECILKININIKDIDKIITVEDLIKYIEEELEGQE